MTALEGAFPYSVTLPKTSQASMGPKRKSSANSGASKKRKKDATLDPSMAPLVDAPAGSAKSISIEHW
jgi:hypothetical protein